MLQPGRVFREALSNECKLMDLCARFHVSCRGLYLVPGDSVRVVAHALRVAATHRAMVPSSGTESERLSVITGWRLTCYDGAGTQ